MLFHLGEDLVRNVGRVFFRDLDKQDRPGLFLLSVVSMVQVLVFGSLEKNFRLSITAVKKPRERLSRGVPGPC